MPAKRQGRGIEYAFLGDELTHASAMRRMVLAIAAKRDSINLILSEAILFLNCLGFPAKIQNEFGNIVIFLAE